MLLNVLLNYGLTQLCLGNEESATSRTLKQDIGNTFEVHCSRERSKAAWQIIEEISTRCGLQPENDLFYEEKYLDKHFDNKHHNLLNGSNGRCLADVSGTLHCDFVRDVPQKTKCNPAATSARNQHLCERLAGNCLPASEGSSSRDVYLIQGCVLDSCVGYAIFLLYYLSISLIHVMMLLNLHVILVLELNILFPSYKQPISRFLVSNLKLLFILV
ncbi:hypothetical protein UlMin_037641 [Ulmus minor]